MGKQYPLYAVPDCDGCERTDCQTCCEHQEHDHYVCMDCGAELDPGVDIDRAMDYGRD